MKVHVSKRKPIALALTLALTGTAAACSGEAGSSDPENIIVDDGGGVGETPTPDPPVDEAPVEEAPVEEAPAEDAPVEEAPAEEAPADEEPTG